MTASAFRLPAEWEPQDGVLLAWPHEGTDWAGNLLQVERCYVGLVGAIARYTRVVLCVPDDTVERHARTLLERAGVNLARLRTVQVDYDDTWLRDSGPVTLTAEDGRYRLLDFAFTGWGGKFGAERDDRMVEALVHADLFDSRAHRQRLEFALEGGAIESDGAGTILTTWRCLHQRHPDLDLETLSARLAEMFGAERTLVLQHGALEGDDTDAHIDTLVRFASPHHLVYQSCDDPGDRHYTELGLMQGELERLRSHAGGRYLLTPLPWTDPIHARDGRRLAASYANFLILDDAVLMPAYGDAADDHARTALAGAFPGREIMPVDCRALIEQNGSLHCVTMQLPRGVLRDG